MEDKCLIIDKKHILYSKAMKKIIMEHLKSRYDEEKTMEIWEKIQLKYAEFLSDLPYLGGKKCTHNGPGGTYDCIALFAYYEVLDDKPSITELYDMNNAVLLPPFRRLGKIANLNKGGIRRAVNKVFETVAKRDEKWVDDCPTSYIMNVEPYDKEIGIRYRFYRCPIAEFAKTHGYTDIMPAFCNGDYPALAEIKAGLIRSTTCSNGDYCDYWIVGDESPHLAKHPMYIDEAGYMRNDLDDDK